MTHIKTAATPDNATLLLGAASELGLDKQVVQVKFGQLVAPAEVYETAGFTVDETGEFATFTKGDKPSGKKKVEARKAETETTRAPAKRTAKKTTAKKTAAKKTTAAPAEKE
jgi:hypothetical protein